MASRPISIEAPSGETVYALIMRLSDGHVFDFNTNVWAALGSAVTPELAMSALLTIGSNSEYVGTLNMATINNGPTPVDVIVMAVHQLGGSPAPATDSAIGEADSFTVINGNILVEGAGNGYRAKAMVVLTTTSGTSAHCKCKLLDATGAVVLDAAATCALDVQRDGVFDQFSVATSDFGAQNANGFFEFDEADPNFTADRGYTGIVTIVSGGVTYKSVDCDFFVAP